VIVVYLVVKIFTGLNKIEDQGQSQTLTVSMKPAIERVVYQPYVSIFDEYRPSGLYMPHFERPSLVPQHSHSQKLINELRAGGRRTPHVNPYRIPPKVVDQGLGAGANPAGAGGGGSHNKFDDSCPIPDKQKLDKNNPEHPSFYSKKKQSAEQCELDENVKDGKI
jgi:hypothetical protein